jgi:hypothetical protein
MASLTAAIAVSDTLLTDDEARRISNARSKQGQQPS